MTTNEIKEVLFKECAEAGKTYQSDKNRENYIKFKTLFSLVADTLDLEYEYYYYKSKNGYETFNEPSMRQILKHLETEKTSRYYIVEYVIELEGAENDNETVLVDECINNFDECKKLCSCTSYKDIISEFANYQSEIFTKKDIHYTGVSVYTLEHDNKIIDIAKTVDVRKNKSKYGEENLEK